VLQHELAADNTGIGLTTATGGSAINHMQRDCAAVDIAGRPAKPQSSAPAGLIASNGRTCLPATLLLITDAELRCMCAVCWLQDGSAPGGTHGRG
jgi:hypothetical protein